VEGLDLMVGVAKLVSVLDNSCFSSCWPTVRPLRRTAGILACQNGKLIIKIEAASSASSAPGLY